MPPLSPNGKGAASRKQPLVLVIMGPPGCGKGTQCPNLVSEYGVCHLSTGDMLRACVAGKGALGAKIKETIDRGALVDDETMIEMIADRVFTDGSCLSNGFILDGFPRTTVQARKLDEMLHTKGLSITCVLMLRVDDSLLVRRICGRLVHPASGRSYHTEFAPPKVPGTDDATGEPLVQRADDNEETLTKRLDAYHRQTAPLEAYYAEKGLLSAIDASRSMDQMWADIRAAVSRCRNKGPS